MPRGRVRGAGRGGAWAGGLQASSPTLPPGTPEVHGVPRAASLRALGARALCAGFRGARPSPAARGFREALPMVPPRFSRAPAQTPGAGGRGACPDSRCGSCALGPRGFRPLGTGEWGEAASPLAPRLERVRDQVSSILPVGLRALSPRAGRGRAQKSPGQPGAAGRRLCPSDLRQGQPVSFGGDSAGLPRLLSQSLTLCNL